jgi:hypothetical protein
LKEIIPPFLEHREGQLATAGETAQNLPGLGELATVHGTQQFSPENGHIPGIAGTDEKMAFVGTGSTAHTDIHENLESPEAVEALAHSIENDLLPVFRKLPVIVQGIPGPGVGQAHVLDALGVRGITIPSVLDLQRKVHPIPFWGHVINLFG